MAELKIGQRWLYDDGGYKFVIEVSNTEKSHGIVLQVIKKPEHSSWKVGEKFTMASANSGASYWKYLSGQDKP